MAMCLRRLCLIPSSTGPIRRNTRSRLTVVVHQSERSMHNERLTIHEIV